MMGDATSRLGAALTEAMAQATAKVRAAVAPAEAEWRSRQVIAHLETMERTMAPVLREALAHALEREDFPEQLKPITEFVLGQKHFAEALPLLAAVAFSARTISDAVLEPFTTQLAQIVWGSHPVRVADVNVVASAYAQGLISKDRAVTEAHGSGVDEERFDMYVEAQDSDPPVTMILELLRRGHLNEQGAKEGFRKAGFLPYWHDDLLKLRWDIPTWREVIQGDVQNQLSREEALHKAERAGLPREEYEWLFGVAGDPIAIGQALELWNRGVIGEHQVEQVIRESRVKTKYVPQVKELRWNYPPPRTVSALLRAGTIDEATGVRLFQYAGLPHDLAVAYAKAALQARHGSTRDLAKGDIVGLYQNGVIARQEAEHLLDSLGYDDTEAGMLLDLADARREVARVNAAIAKVRARYTGRKIDRPEAAAALDALGVPPTTRDDLIATWDVEREVEVRLPTEAQLAEGLRRGLIDVDTYAQKLREMGYQEDDVQFLVALRGAQMQGRR